MCAVTRQLSLLQSLFQRAARVSGGFVLAGIVLAQDGFARDRRNGRAVSIVHVAILVALMFVSSVLMILERVDYKPIHNFRTVTFDLISPVLEQASAPAMYVQHIRRQVNGYMDLYAELERSKAENQQMKQWQWRAQQLETETREYRKLLMAVDDSSYGFATGRVIADGRSPFVRTALINIGRAQGVINGYAVVNSDGFVGHVLETGEHSARVLLFIDINSRIPVEIGSTMVRAIMRGDGDSHPVVEFVPSDKLVAVGDEVLTSGQDGLLPRGLPIGRIVRSDSGFRVVPRVDLNQLDFASVLFHAAPGLELINSATASADVSALRQK